ncbi:MAG: hypothetical protein ACREQZ_06320 [Woeseiaceae bacterium]
MIKRTLMTVAVVATAALASNDGLALQRKSDGADGCARLQNIVAAQIGAVADGFSWRSSRSAGSGAKSTDGAVRCARTAQAATKAFSRVMFTLGIPVYWEDDWYPGIPPGDYCLSGDLSQCYPRTTAGGFTAMQLGFVHNAWKAVRRSVSAQMPYGEQSDMSVFETDSLAVALRQRLQRELDGTLPRYSHGPKRDVR